jgi:hypothetical protein
MTKHSFEPTALGALASVAHDKYTSNKMLKQPLYRKVHSRARGVHHNFGGEYRHGREPTQRNYARWGVYVLQRAIRR